MVPLSCSWSVNDKQESCLLASSSGSCVRALLSGFPESPYFSKVRSSNKRVNRVRFGKVRSHFD